MLDQPPSDHNPDNTTITLQNQLWLALRYFLRSQVDHVARAIRNGQIGQDLTPNFSNRELMALLSQVDAELTLALFPVIARTERRERQ